jgi:Domain of unknown function (DUF4157)
LDAKLTHTNSQGHLPAASSLPVAAAIGTLQQSEGHDIHMEPLQGVSIQHKLSIGSVDDPLEHEADAMANKVMRMPEQPLVQRKCSHCEEEEKVQMKPLAASITPFIQAKGVDGGNASDTVSQQINASRGSGSNMDRPTQSFMESRFGADFSDVKIHTGEDAVQMSREMDAQAFTVGNDIYFNSGKYNPSSNSGKHLLAHELTHTIQQAGSQATIINRFAESEHKRIGNLATTHFPYYAGLTTDEVALRSSPKGRKTGNEFHNLTASLRKNARLLVVGNTGKWMRVIAVSGDSLDGKTNNPVKADGLAGYVSEELLKKEPGIFDQQLPLVPGLTLTYGDFTAMGGDHFAKFADLEDKASGADGVAKINKFIDVVDGRRKGEYEDAGTIDAEWAERYKNLAFENIPHFSKGGTALETWKKNHYQALKGAANGAYMGNFSMVQRAYAINAFGDHFLTDSFSGGHIRVPRMKIIEHYKDFFDQHLDSILNYIYLSIGDQIVLQLFQDHPNITGTGLLTGHNFCTDNKKAISTFREKAEEQMKSNNLGPADLKKLLTHYVGGAVSKVLHDDDNKNGLNVKSKKHPEGWKAFGDGRLDAVGQKFVVEAVEVSKNELVKAINIGLDLKNEKDDPKLYEKVKPWVYPVSEIESYIPETDITKEAPLPEWRLDPTGWDMMAQPMQLKLAALVKKYLDDKTLEAMIGKIDKSVELEVDWSPNVYARPRDATRIVIQKFRDNPAEFLELAANAPEDFNKLLETSLACSMGI